MITIPVSDWWPGTAMRIPVSNMAAWDSHAIPCHTNKMYGGNDSHLLSSFLGHFNYRVINHIPTTVSRAPKIIIAERSQTSTSLLSLTLWMLNSDCSNRYYIIPQASLRRVFNVVGGKMYIFLVVCFVYCE